MQHEHSKTLTACKVEALVISAPSVTQQVKTQSSNTIQNKKMNMRRICAILNTEMKQTLCISVDEQFEDSDVDYEFLEI